MRHWILVTVAAAGCGGAVPTVPRPSKPASIEPLAPQPGSYRLARPLSPIELPIDPRLGLAATLTPRWPIRAWPRPDSVGGVTDGAGPLALSSLQSLPVVALDADRMRVVAESNGLRLLLWSPRTSFAPVVTRELAASARPDGPSPRVFESGVFVAPGLRVTYRRGAWWHINGINGLRLDAWIPDTAVADWYSPGLEPVERTQADRIAARTVVRARASDASAIVATFDAEHSIEVSHTHGDWVEIDARFVGVRVHGFVNRDSVTRWSPLAARASGGYGPYGSYGGGGMVGGMVGGTFRVGRTRTPPPTVPIGSCLFDRDDQLVGVVTRPRSPAIELALDGRWFDPAQPDLRFRARTKVTPPAVPALESCPP